MKFNKGSSSSSRTLKGFTLIELIVVIAIIGILANIMGVIMNSFVRDSRLEANNNKAKMAYEAFQDILLSCEVKGDKSLFENHENDYNCTIAGHEHVDDIVGAIVFFRISEFDHAGNRNKNGATGLGDEVHIMAIHKNVPHNGMSGWTNADHTCSRSVWIKNTQIPDSNNPVYGGYNSTPDKGAAKWEIIEKAISGRMDKAMTGSYVLSLDLENYQVLSSVYVEIPADGLDPKTGLYDVNETTDPNRALQKYIKLYDEVKKKDGSTVVKFPEGVGLVKNLKHEKDIWKKCGLYVGAYPFGDDMYLESDILDHP